MNGLMKLARFALYFFALGFLGFGALFLVAPANLTALAEVALPTPVAVMEIRGVYGGLFLGIGVLLLVFARHEPWLRPGLVTLAAIMGGLVVGRTLGLILDGAANPLIYALLISEVVGFVIAFVALRG